MKMKILAVLCGCFISNVVFAECPKNLNSEKMVECIMIEGSGVSYQEWLKEYNDSLTAEASTSEISPVTGTDIHSFKPAAGNTNK